MASFTERYHELTKYNPNTIDKLGAVHWEDQPQPFKSPGPSDKIELAGYLQTPLKNEEAGYDLLTLAHGLHFTCGITSRLDTPSGNMFLRANPSAGGLYPTELYSAVRDTRDIPDGLYHYHPLHSALYPLKDGKWGRLSEMILNQPVSKARWVFIYTGVFARSVWRYKERAYRRILLDTGHALGNTLELTQAWGFNASVFRDFFDMKLGEYMELNSEEERPLTGVAFYPSAIPGPLVQCGSGLTSISAGRADPEAPMYLQQNQCESISKPFEVAKVLPTAEYSKNQKAPLNHVLATIASRRSCREYAGDPIKEASLREILQFAYGHSSHVQWAAMGQHISSFLLIFRVSGTSPGIYEFDPMLDKIHLKKQGDFQSESYQMCLGQNLAASCAFTLIHTVDLPALTRDYGDRGYRYACLEAGQIGERINLKCGEMELGSSGIGGYFDDLVNQVLDLPLNHGVLYLTTVGVPA